MNIFSTFTSCLFRAIMQHHHRRKANTHTQTYTHERWHYSALLACMRRDDVFFSRVFNFQTQLFPTNDCKGEFIAAFFRGRSKLYFLLHSARLDLSLHLPLSLPRACFCPFYTFFSFFFLCVLVENVLPNGKFA